jgi:hypothetical protein
MIRPLLVALSLMIAAPALAQTPAPGATPQSRMTPEQREQRRAEIRAVRDGCRDETRAGGLRGPERREAMKRCILARKPELAKPMACAEEARARNLPRGTERRDFMRACMATQG